MGRARRGPRRGDIPRLLIDAQPVRKFGKCRLAAERGRELVAGALDLDRQFLLAARDAQRPCAVAEVAAKLAEDRRYGVAGERRPALGVEAVDGVQEADGGDLLQVLDRLGGVDIARGEAVREREITLDRGLPVGGAAAAAQAREQLPLVVEGRPLHTSKDDRERAGVTPPVAPDAR